MSNTQPTLLVTGASGHLGRRVLELLLETQTGQIIATTRNPEKLADFSARGVIVRHADFDDADGLVEAFRGADRLLLISTDVVGQGDARLHQHQNAVKAAEKAGVSHVIYTSLPNPEPGTPIVLAADHYGTEQALAASTLDWTILRNNIYAEMLVSAFSQALQSGTLVSAAADGKTAYVTREDCARASAAALASSFTGRRTLDVTGAAAYSYYDLAALATEISGKTITYIPVEAETLIGYMTQAGLPRPIAEAYASFDVGIAQNKLSNVSTTLEELTGKPGATAAEFLASQRETILA